MQSRILLYGQDARARLQKGIDALADMVAVTLGPKGRNVILDRKYGGPLVTKDGVTVAKEIFLKDIVENMGAQLVREVASRTAEVAGDGTTTATVLAQAIVKEGLRNVTAGANPMDLKRGIDSAVVDIVSFLKANSKKVETTEEIIQVGTISANGDVEIGKLIADAMTKVGNDGIITIEDASGVDTFLEIVEGMQFDRGYLSPYFITRVETMEAEFSDPYILLYDGRLNNLKDIVHILDICVEAGKPILIIAEEVEGDVLKTLVFNRVKGIIKVCAVKAPGFGDRRKEILQDIAVLTGATLFADDGIHKLGMATEKGLGVAEKVVVGKDTTIIVQGAGKGEDIKKRIEQIRLQIEQTTSDYDKEKLQERLAKLAGGVAVLKVGATTEVELKEKKARVEDALHATRAAVEEGILPGGGVAYVRVKPYDMLERIKIENDDQELGIKIVIMSLSAPLKRIVQNAGVSGEVVLDKVVESNEFDFGYNAQTNMYGSMFKMGVVDPTKVVRSALENAASIAGLFLTTEGVVAESIEEKEAFEKLVNVDRT